MKVFDCRLHLLLGITVTSVLCAETVIGVASTRGNMEVNHAAVRGNANVSDGSLIRTNDTVSRVNLQNGVEVTLGQRTAASIHSDRLLLLAGDARVSSRNGYGVEALGFRVAPEKGDGVSSVSFENPNRILITASSAPVNVSGKTGVLLARVAPGTTYFFEPDSDDDPAQTAGKKPAPAKATKAGLSKGAKWGIVGAAAAATGVGLGVGLSGDSASR